MSGKYLECGSSMVNINDSFPRPSSLKMSAAKATVEEADVCCANCGVAEVDDIKLKDCDGRDLVKYCSDKCTENHREQHDEECKRRLIYTARR